MIPCQKVIKVRIAYFFIRNGAKWAQKLANLFGVHFVVADPGLHA
jgi:hypothetical protein